MSPNRLPHRRRSALLVGAVGLLLTAGCLGSVGTSVDDPRSVARQVDARYDSLDEYRTTIERTVSVGDSTATTRATLRFVKDESLRIAYETGPRAGTVTVVDDPTPSTLLATDAAQAETAVGETPASYGAVAANLVRTNNVTYSGTTVLDGRAAVVLALEPTANETATNLVERRVWIDAERRVPLRVVSTWRGESGEITETLRFTNTSLSVANATPTDGRVAA
ncbi:MULTISPECIES: outer membrane lipoprotein-sorting protein [Halorussus]|uniref:outer membrane lipoprotein-sorting protein n=1 Tax=Halorussus TaxID=1070314 RepID=UPI000E20C9D2|nr:MULTISPECIES: outer membrane lipoprotein-sorting protein [Halorussus]NHN59480.1 outer membrane lipoprotein-sorting protein [Halorussus sp. JP-T4]